MRKVLVVVDMQKDFIDGTLGTVEAQAIVQPVIEKMKSLLREIRMAIITWKRRRAQNFRLSIA